MNIFLAKNSCSSLWKGVSYLPLLSSFASMKVMFFGSDAFAHPVLKSLEDGKKQSPDIISSLSVVTHVKSSKSKKSVNLVEKLAQDSKLTIYNPVGITPNNRKNEWQDFSSSEAFKGSNAPDIGVVCSYGYMIPSYIIDKFPKGMLVIHPSLLPKYRGASPLQYALINGDKITGTSIIEISKLQFDAGKILMQKTFEIPQKFTYKELSAALSELSSKAIIEVLKNYDEVKQAAVNQDESACTKAPKFMNSDINLDFESEDAKQIYNRYRCFKGTNFVSVRTQYNNKEIILDKISPVTPSELNVLNKLINSSPASVWAFKQKSMKNYLYVKCKEGFIRLDEWRFFDQTSRPAYTFVDQFLDRDSIANNLEGKGTVFFEKISTAEKQI